MNSKQRFLNVLSRKKTDRLPVTTHHLMPSFLKNYMNGISDQEFFDYFGLDPVKWIIAHTYDASKGEYFDPLQNEIGFLEARRICTDNWMFTSEDINGLDYTTWRLNIVTPDKTLSMILQSDKHTTWLNEHVIKEKSDIDILELGGGDASTTVISPDIFNEFVAPYDAPLIEAAHKAGQRISYHTCGGMMPILEDIASMKPDAMETFSPPAMGGDTVLAEAKKRIGDKVCMIGSFDQFHFFTGCSEQATRNEVRRCFEAAGTGGGFILSPSDHFFEADLKLIMAFADEAKKCIY